MKFLSDILAKAGLTVDGVVTLNNTATGQTPDANDNSTKLATTAWVRTFVQPYSLPIATASILGGIKVGSGLSINSTTGVLSVSGAGAASIKSTQTFVVTEGQTVFTVTGGYTPGLMDVFVNGVYLSPNQITATNGTTFTINDPAATGDIVDVIVVSAIYEGATTTTDQLPEGVVNLYYTNARARAAITLTTTGVSGAATYNSSTGVFNIPNYQGLVPAGGVAGDILAKVSGTNYDVTWIPNYTSQVQHIVKAGVAVTKGQAVYVSSADGTNMIVSKASNASEQTSSKTLGLVAQDLAINGQGFVVTEGLLAGLNTSTANAGDPVWLGTDGNLIFGLLNKPTAPAHLVFVGIVTRVQQNNGEIFVKVQNGFEMSELHDYVESGVQNNFVISYESSTSLYKPKSIATLLGYTPANAARTLTINGTSYDLTANRTWNVGTVTSVAALTIGTSGTDITSTVANSTTTPVITLNVPDASASARGVITTGTQTIAGGKYFSDNIAVGHTSPFDVSQFSLDVNGGLLVKNSSKTAQFVLINSNPALGGNNAFVIHTVGGSSGTSYADIQGYYGTSIAGSTVLRLNPQGGNVLIGNLAGSGSRMVVASATGILSTQAIQTLSDLSGVPTSRTITINSTTQDLSTNRTFTLYTDDISEDGSPVNLWFTNARARAAISVTGSGSYDSATGVITVTGGVTSVNTLTGAVTLTTSNIAEGTNLYYTDTRVGTYLTANSYATQSYVSTQINNLVSGAPGLLDTLDELAAALGDDPNFATTVSTALGNRLRVDINNQGLTSTQQGNGRTNLGLGSLAVLSSVGNAQITDLAYSKLTGVPSTFAPSAHTHPISDIVGLQTALDGKQASLSGTGFVKISGSTISYDNSTYYLASNPSGYITGISFANVSAKPTTIAGYGITDSLVYTTSTYSNPSWITALAWSKITGAPAFITGYTEVDTLASVTGRGSSTSSSITLSGAVNIYNTDSNDFRLYYQGAGSGSARVYYHQPTNELRIYATTASPEATTSIGSLKLYISSVYRAVLHEANYSSYALPLSGGTVTGKTNIGTGGSTNGGIFNVTGGTDNQMNISHNSSWGLLLGYCNESSPSGYHGPNHAAIINVQDAPLHLGSNNSSVLRIVSTGASILGNTVWHAGNDGSGSGLDADTVDGVQLDNIVYGNVRGTNDSITTDADGLDRTGFYTSSAFTTRPASVSNWMYIQHIKLYSNNTAYQKQIGYDTYDDRMWVRTKNSNAWSSWKQIWTSDSLTNLNQLSNGPGYITSYSETDTLSSVTGRGNTTSSSMAIGSGSIPNGRLYVNSSSSLDVVAIQTTTTGAALAFADNTTPTWANAPRIVGVHNDFYIRTLATNRVRVTDGGNTWLYGDLYLGSSNTKIASTIATGYITLSGSSTNYVGIGPYNNNGWAYFENFNNNNGTYYYVSAGRHAFDGGPVTPYSDGARDLGTSSYRWGNIYTTGALINNSDGAIMMESNASENNNWIFKESSKAWGIFYFNRGSQSGQNIGGSYSSVGAETIFMGQNVGIAMPSGWSGYYNGSKIAAYVDHNTGVMFSAGSMRSPIFYDSDNPAYYLDPNSNSRLLYAQYDNIGVGQGYNSSYRIITSGDIYLNANANGWAEGVWKQRRGGGSFYDVIDAGNYAAYNSYSNLYTNTLSVGSDCYAEKVFDLGYFSHGVANIVAYIDFGNIQNSGYLEVEVNSTYSNQNATGLLRKILPFGTNVNGGQWYSGDSKVQEANGSIPDNIFIGDLEWSGTNFRLPIYHVVSSGNSFRARVKYFTQAGNAAGILNGASVSTSTRTAPANWTNNPAYNRAIDTRDIRMFNNNVLGWRYSSGDSNMYNYIYNSYDDTTTGITYRSGNWTSSQGIVCHRFQTYTSGWQNRLTIYQDGGVIIPGRIDAGNIYAPTYYSSVSTSKYLTNNGSSYGSWYIGGSQGGYSGFRFDGDMQLMMHTNGAAGPCGFWLGNWSILTYVNAAQYLYNNGSEKFRTASDGIVVTGTVYATGDVIAYYSDIRLKKDVTVIDSALDKIQRLRGVTYTWNDEEVNKVKDRAGTRDIGLIAQEVEAVEPLLITEYQTQLNTPSNDPDEANNFVAEMSETYKTIKYEKLVALLVEAMKEQQTQIESQKSEIEELKDLVKQLINR
jgi:hypothetical protein